MSSLGHPCGSIGISVVVPEMLVVVTMLGLIVSTGFGLVEVGTVNVEVCVVLSNVVDVYWGVVVSKLTVVDDSESSWRLVTSNLVVTSGRLSRIHL